MTGAPVRVVGALGTAQTLAWASSYYLPAMLAAPMAADLGVATPTVFAAFSGAMVVSALVGPWAGLAIDRHGGRVVLAGTSLVFALGLGMLGFAQGLWTMVIAWLVIGAAMGAGLYEAAFSSLVRLYGQHARGAITGITLLAGFASTVGWPLSAWMETRFGWRNACLGWAGIHLLIGLPLNAWLPTLPSPAQPERTAAADPAQAIASASPSPVAAAGGAGYATALLAFVFAATWFISTAMATHLPRMLEAAGATLAAAVAVGALVGPAQVAGRVLEFGFLRRVHPLLSARLAALAHPAGVTVLLMAGPVAAPPFRDPAWGGQRHPHHREGHLAAGAVWRPGLRRAPGLADAAGPHRPGACPAAFRAGAGRLGGQRFVAVRRHRPGCLWRADAAARPDPHTLKFPSCIKRGIA